MPVSPHAHQPGPVSAEERWDRFIDEVDAMGQAGRLADVVIPLSLHAEAPGGRRFGDLTSADIRSLAHVAKSLNREDHTLKSLWNGLQRKNRAERLKQKRDARPA